VTPSAKPLRSLISGEFQCSGCGGNRAYRSHARGFFERFGLPLLLLRPARCAGCDLRGYVSRTTPLLERATIVSRLNQTQQPLSSTSRVA
jgi:hypothetical protein